MKKFCDFIIKKRLWVTIIFGVITLAMAACIPFINVSYNDIDYLPSDSDLSIGLKEMTGDFGASGNCSAMVKNVDVAQAMEMKSKIIAISGVKTVMWIDDILSGIISDAVKTAGISKTEGVDFMLDIIYAMPDNASDLSVGELLSLIMNLNQSHPKYASFVLALSPIFTSGDFDLSMIKEFRPQLESFYKDNNAYFQIMFVKSDYDSSTVSAIGKIRGLSDNVYLAGQAATTYNSQQTMTRETLQAMLVVVVIILIILFLTCTSFWEPVLYIIVIGVAVIINMGSNIILGTISYMTESIAGVLQLALTIDYSIFLLNRFKRERKAGLNPEEAMSNALRHSFSPISASSLTTIASFVALMFMRYKMGFDIGIVLTKGVVLSLISVFFLMPALAVYTHKLIEKSEHKTFNLNFKKSARGLIKSRFILPVFMLAIIIPCFYFQSMNDFRYGNEASLGSEGSIIAEDKKAIEEVFGKQNQLVLLIPKEYAEKELQLSYALLSVEEIGSVQSLSIIRESGFDSLLPAEFLKQFQGEQKYNRIIMNILVSSESAETTALLRRINEITDSYIGNMFSETGKSYYVLGEAPATDSIKEIVVSDYKIITYVSILLVAAVLIATYRSLIIPALLLLIIQGSVYINMAIPFLMGEPIVFIGYLLVSAILLGATVDYAILLTSHYMENRKQYNKYDSAQLAMAQSSRALITSAGIFALGGFSIGLVSSMPATSLFGMAIGRGGICAFILVMFCLPQLLVLFDSVIRKTTFRGKKNMADNKTALAAPEVRPGIEFKETNKPICDNVDDNIESPVETDKEK